MDPNDITARLLNQAARNQKSNGGQNRELQTAHLMQAQELKAAREEVLALHKQLELSKSLQNASDTQMMLTKRVSDAVYWCMSAAGCRVRLLLLYVR